MKPIFHRASATRGHFTLKFALASPICAGLGLISAANAQTIGNSYTLTSQKDCRVTGAAYRVDDSTIRVCPGKAGLVVLVGELAGKAADEVARGFKCGTDEVKVIGQSGRAVELAQRR